MTDTCQHLNVDYRFNRMGGQLIARRWVACADCSWTAELPNDLDAATSPAGAGVTEEPRYLDLRAAVARRARILGDLKEFDGDRRGMMEALGDCEKSIVRLAAEYVAARRSPADVGGAPAAALTSLLEEAARAFESSARVHEASETHLAAAVCLSLAARLREAITASTPPTGQGVSND